MNNNVVLSESLKSMLRLIDAEKFSKGEEIAKNLTLYLNNMTVKVYVGDIEYVTLPDFNQEQISEIVDGLKEGIDFSSYANKDLSACDMRTIKEYLIRLDHDGVSSDALGLLSKKERL